MSMIRATGSDRDAPRIGRWPDGGGIAVLTWYSADGRVHEQEVSDEQQAVHLLKSIEADDELTLTSAQLRRRGTSPSGS
jgi:hypothetical protein